ncbi:ATP-grasp domain-containing protein [Nesterenkonia sp. MY13]|uniref:ATP-grasp domain-containing protein n=1 Tax=Nesterenkonia sedimenti TaxID=1463632 RepID=A0A7X8YE33_9MICC|nr:acylphosphatase [Nesterenkonia sedimenti]NLS10060.1 ATP-grasp domain-containing protein [Nesterenkonia sedimenti]
MRLSIPIPGKRPATLAIVETEAIAYRVPMDLTAEESQRTVAPFNYLITLKARSSQGEEYVGVGEAQPRANQTGDLHEQSWPFLDRLLEELVGFELKLNDPLEDIRQWVAYMEAEAGTDEENVVFRNRATVMGLETALMDLAAKAKKVTLADLLGRRRLSSSETPRVLRAKEDYDIEEFFAGLPRNYRGPVRVVGGETVDDDVAHMRKVTEIRRTQRPRLNDEPLWVNFRSRYDFETAQDAIRQIHSESAAGHLPQTIIIQNPTSQRPDPGAPDLQQFSDSLNSLGEQGPDIHILRRSAGPNDTAELINTLGNRLRAINLRPAQLGGILRTLETAEKISSTAPEAKLLLTQSPGASRVTQIVHRDLAKVLPQLTWATASAEVDKRFHVSRRASSKLRSPLLRRGTGLIPDYKDLISRSRARVRHPKPNSTAQFGDTPPNTYSDVDYIAPIGSYAVHGHIVEREALARGLNSWRFTKSSIVVSDDHGKKLPFRTTRWPKSGVVASSVARHKEATRILLKRAGCPVPEGRTFHGNDQSLALQYAARIGYPVVLKPAEGSMGVGVMANIRSEEELVRALELFSTTAHGNNEFIVEKHINGGDYRIMVIGDEVAAAVERIPANITGDGQQTVAQLIIDKNMARRENSHLGPLKIKWTPAVEYELEKQGLSINSIVPEGKRIYLLSTNNLTQGGDSIEILDDLHPSIKEACVKAVKAVPGMGYCGVDFLLEDHTKPLDEQDAAICELNAMAALPVAEYPMYGTPRRLSERFILECAKDFGLEVWPERAEQLHLKLVIRGGITGVGYRRWFGRRAERSGLRGWIRSTGEREAEAVISGSVEAVTAMATLAVLGPPKSAPESVKSTHLGAAPTEEGFTVLDEDQDLVGAKVGEPGSGSDVEDFEEVFETLNSEDQRQEHLEEYAPNEAEQVSAEELEDRAEEAEHDESSRA